MRIDQIAERLRTDRVHLDPDIETDFPIIRKEAEDFAQAMREAKGRPDDAPRMYFSALVNDRSHAKNVDEFHDAIVVVVSVGGTNTHYRALEIKGRPHPGAHGRLEVTQEQGDLAQDPHALRRRRGTHLGRNARPHCEGSSPLAGNLHRRAEDTSHPAQLGVPPEIRACSLRNWYHRRHRAAP